MSNLLNQAESEAKHVVCQWIRKVLQEVFVQTLQRSLTVHPNSRLELSSEGLQQCIHAVEVVSKAWQEKLVKADYELVAEWVEHVFQQGKESVWDEEVVVAEDRETLHKESISNDVKDNAVGSNTVDEEQMNDVKSASHSSNTMIPYCELRNLGRRTRPGEDQISIEDALDKLQKMGQSGQSYWPLDWNIVAQACDDIPNRIRYGQQERSESFQIIPKILWEKQQMEEGEATSRSQEAEERGNNDRGNDDAILTSILQRKRKNFVRDSTPRQQKKRKEAVAAIEEPRPPSDISEIFFHCDELLSEEDKSKLSLLIHDENDNSSAPLVLFGALSKVGDMHHKVMQENRPKPREQLTEKQTRRLEKISLQERLFPHRIMRNSDPSTYRSKILRTEDEKKQEYMDLDLGWCLMEVRRAGERTKRLCVFSSLEVSLLDANEVEESQVTNSSTRAPASTMKSL